MIVRAIETSRIFIGERLRALDPAWVDLFVEEIRERGQDEPIRVAEIGSGFHLIAGARYLAAHIKLGRELIEAVVEPAAEEPSSGDALLLAEIKSNLMRGELTVLERAIYISAWRDIYDRSRPPAKRGRKSKSDPQASEAPANDDADMSAFCALNFSEAAQRALKISRRSVFLALKIAGIDRQQAHRLTGHPVADSRSELLLLTEQSGPRQKAIVDLLIGDAAEVATVAEAIIQLDGTAAPVQPSPYERIHQTFARLPEPQQHAFFDLNAEAIERWLAARGQIRKLRKVA